MTGTTPFFTNLVDSDDTTAEVIGAASSEGVEDDVHLSYRNVTDIKKVGCACHDFSVRIWSFLTKVLYVKLFFRYKRCYRMASKNTTRISRD